MSNKHQLWGGRFVADPDQQMKALNDSITFDYILYQADIVGSLAYLRALSRADLITDDETATLEDSLRRIFEEWETGEFQIQPGDEDIHTAIERRLIELVGSVGGKLHTGRSRNDQIATDIRLWLRSACDTLTTLLQNVQQALIDQAEQHIDTLMPGYTHLQPAQPITAAHWLMSFVWMLQRDRERLEDCRRRTNNSPLGSSALAGTPYPIDREALAADLEFDGVTANSLDAVSDRDPIAEFLFVASLLSVHLSRLAEDVLMYSNPAFGFIRLPDAFSTGSSIMPQKRNADPMELARGKTGRLIGNLTGLLTTLKGLPSGYNKDLQEDKEPLFDTFSSLTTLLPVMAGMIRVLELVPGSMRAALDDGLLATELADWLVLEKRVPFREAHHLVGQVIKLAEVKRVELRDLTFADYQGISTHFDANLFDVLDFEAAVARRTVSGGTAPEAVRQQIKTARQIVGSLATITISPIQTKDREQVRDFWIEHWASSVMVSRGQTFHIDDLPGFIAWQGNRIIGMVTYQISDDECEITSLDSLFERQGIGNQLLQQIVAIAREANCRRVWLITTNANMDALRFYQKRGFQLVAVYPGAINRSREIKPEIPLTGNDGIPIRDEIELELVIQ